ncbi:MAG: hypothetical protein CMA87_04750 [Euryarchaeota archaeon]|nr:hypothetical protein [Euryarchaeota archaeon]
MIEEFAENEGNKNLFSKILSMKFSAVDMRLASTTGFFGSLLIAKLWDPILSLEWHWYGILSVIACIKPFHAFFKQW